MADQNSAPPLRLIEASRSYRQGGRDLRVFDGISLTLHAGEAVGLLGPSGSGKSSLLHMAGLLEKPSGGEVVVMGRERSRMRDGEASFIRRAHIGFVFQFHHLLPEFSALENAALAAMIGGMEAQAARRAAEEVLRRLEMGARLDHKPPQLSGGEQQRVAVARALVNRPSLLLADEPTGNLDPQTARLVFSDLIREARAHGAAVLVATHNETLAREMDRIARIGDGRMEERKD